MTYIQLRPNCVSIPTQCVRVSDLEEVPVHYVMAAGRAQDVLLQGARGVDGGRGGRGEGERRVRVLLEDILRPRGTLSEENTIL